MGVPEKLAEKATERLEVEVLAAAMVVPPGATLYKAYSPSSKAIGGGGAIAAALMSKAHGSAGQGRAATVPTSQGVLAVTADHVVYLKKKLIGVGVGEKLIDWPRNEVAFVFEDNGKWKYPGLLLEFQDGSHCTVYGEKKWGLEGIAIA